MLTLNAVKVEQGTAMVCRRRRRWTTVAAQSEQIRSTDGPPPPKATERYAAELLLDADSVPPRTLFQTGTMESTTSGATLSFSRRPLVAEKLVVFIRHGISTWNAERRIQGATEEAELTQFGEAQAERCRAAISGLYFDSCFTSPIRRAARTAEIVWSDREGPLISMDALREADLGILQGLKNDVAAVEYADLYDAWRNNPSEFCIEDRYPVREVFEQAKLAWESILASPGVGHLVVTHKSILRAMLCTALGLPPTSFRCVDVNNGGICTFRINKSGEPMLTGLNLTSHLHTDGISY